MAGVTHISGEDGRGVNIGAKIRSCVDASWMGQDFKAFLDNNISTIRKCRLPESRPDINESR